MLPGIALVALASPVSPPDGAAISEFAAWAARHNKQYATTAEHESRYATWLTNRDWVAQHNARKDITWSAKVNEFADLTWAEFKAAHLMTPQNCSATHKSSGWKPLTSTALPEAIDWREKITPWPVKSQGHCGSCWTFSTAGSMEAHYYLKHAMLKNLSEQQLVDCADAFNNHGCNGGLPSQAFEYLHYAGGQDTETAYPYTAITGKTCKYDGAGAAQVSAVNNITSLDEDELTTAVGTTGPVSIAFQVSHDFRFYDDGVYDGVCDTGPADVNHAVVAVGYGRSKSAPLGKDYFIVRNSWGAGWGVDGYFKIKRGANKCGLADCASFPTVA